jgi:hypothetical protein
MAIPRALLERAHLADSVCNIGRPKRPTPSWGGRCSNPGENSGSGSDISWRPRESLRSRPQLENSARHHGVDGVPTPERTVDPAVISVGAPGELAQPPAIRERSPLITSLGNAEIRRAASDANEIGFHDGSQGWRPSHRQALDRSFDACLAANLGAHQFVKTHLPFLFGFPPPAEAKPPELATLGSPFP